MGVCARFGVPVVARGGGTSLAGQTAGGRGLVLDTSRHMTAIGAIEGRTARVQPGVVQEDLNRAAKRHGLGFGPDTSTSNRATLGGMIGNNSSGSESIVYGTTIDHVLSLEVVLADGTRAAFAEGTTHPLDAPAAACCGTPARDRARLPRHGASRRTAGPARPVQPGEADRRLRGHARARHRSHRQARRAAEGEDVRRRAFRVGGGRDRRDRAGARAGPERGRDDRPQDPLAVALQARVPPARGPAAGRSGRAAVRQLRR